MRCARCSGSSRLPATTHSPSPRRASSPCGSAMTSPQRSGSTSRHSSRPTDWTGTRTFDTSSRTIRVGPGRGSAAGSVVSYSLRITDLDPLRYDLIFERFLNPGRIQMPDIDMDFDERRRDEVIRYVASKYSSDRVAQIITFQTIKGKQGIRDSARVLGFPASVGDRLCKMYPAAIM